MILFAYLCKTFEDAPEKFQEKIEKRKEGRSQTFHFHSAKTVFFLNDRDGPIHDVELGRSFLRSVK